jgi:hypothetical protein
MNLDTFKERIAQAFANVPAPRPPLINHVCEECLALQKSFEGKSWQDVASEIIKEHFSDLSLFSPEAFHGFVAAYLIHSVGNMDADDCVSEFAAYAFLPDKEAVGDEEHARWWRSKLTLFSDEQFSLILKYLDLVEQTDEHFDRSLLKRGRERLINLRNSALDQ